MLARGRPHCGICGLVQEVIGVEEADDRVGVQQGYAHSSRSCSTALRNAPLVLSAPLNSSSSASVRVSTTRPGPIASALTASPGLKPASVNAFSGIVTSCLAEIRVWPAPRL